MSNTLDFMFDFGSPNAYLAWKVLPPILDRTGATLNVFPILLGGVFKLTGNQAPMTAFGGVKGKLEYERLETQRFIDRHGLSAFRINPHFPVNTLIVMRGLIAAQRKNAGHPYVEVVLKAMWEEGRKMDDPEVIGAVLEDAGLDAKAILEATQDLDVKTELVSNTSAAVARGVFGVPTFFVGQEMFFGKERLSQVEEELKR